MSELDYCGYCLEKDEETILIKCGEMVEKWLWTGEARPSWPDFFLGMAVVASLRSHDLQTKCGCVITDDENKILGIGYNGFAKGMRDKLLPRVRPRNDEESKILLKNKHAWMIHSEENAVSNCQLKPKNATAYITVEPCGDCTQHLWQNGITHIIYRQGFSFKSAERYLFEQRQIISEHTGLKITPHKADLSWLVGAILYS